MKPIEYFTQERVKRRVRMLARLSSRLSSPVSARGSMAGSAWRAASSNRLNHFKFGPVDAATENPRIAVHTTAAAFPPPAGED
uniref:Uncharacterized protein n=1 Tax=Macrostomum lignano TaxID=282301 RepID=A0A1I8FK71_9PLAT